MKPLKSLALLPVFVFILTLPGQAQNTSIDSAGATFTTVLPLVFYTPETSLGLGAAAVHNFYPGENANNRPSQLQGGGAYTLKNQLLLYISYQLYLNGNRTELFGELGYYDYVYFYYGTGNQTLAGAEEVYQVRFPRFRINALEQIFPNVRAGLSFKFDRYDIYDIAAGGLLDTQQPIGFAGGNIATLGAVFRYDTRDNVNLPLNGWLVTLTMEQNGRFFGSPYRYQRLLLDAVRYQSLGKDQTLALNFYTGAMSKGAPFQELFFLGGPKKARGIIEGRFREKMIMLWQAAYRFPIKGRFRGTVFASTGRVAVQYEDLFSGQYHLNYGLGARFLLNKQERVQLRLDVGFGGDALGYYLTVNDAF